MIDIRDMELLSALAHHGHFARAAEACGISQPAFSARIRNLELALGTPVVKRGNRFQGFTREGEIALAWARSMLADRDGLMQEIAEAKGRLEGRLRIGVVPTALGYIARAPALLQAAHPKLMIQIVSSSSSEIRADLEDFTIDAGITYADAALPAASRASDLYLERYLLVCPPALAPRPAGSVTWAEAARLPLCLLTQNMRNRRIIDDAFAGIGTRPDPLVESNSFTVALQQVAQGIAATIAPMALAEGQAIAPDAVLMPLTDPLVEKRVVIVTSDREPEPPAVRALRVALAPLSPN